MRLVSLGAQQSASKGYTRIDAEFEHAGQTTKKSIWIGGVMEAVAGLDAAVIYSVTRHVKEAVRDMAFAATGDIRAWDKEDQTKLITEIIMKINEVNACA